MAEKEIISLEEAQQRLKDQKVPQEHLAFKCPMCGTIQSDARGWYRFSRQNDKISQP